MKWPFVARSLYDAMWEGWQNREREMGNDARADRETIDRLSDELRRSQDRYASLVTEMLAMKREGFVVPPPPIAVPEPDVPGPNALAAIEAMSSGKSDPFYAANYAYAMSEKAKGTPDQAIADAIRRGV